MHVLTTVRNLSGVKEVCKEVPGICGNLVVKSKLPPRSGTSLEVVERHP